MIRWKLIAWCALGFWQIVQRFRRPPPSIAGELAELRGRIRDLDGQISTTWNATVSGQDSREEFHRLRAACRRVAESADQLESVAGVAGNESGDAFTR